MKVIIVGGVAGGATAAARIRRLDETAEIIIFERSGFISYANCGLPYYIGGVIEDEEDLTLQTPESFFTRFRINAHVRHEVTAIDPQAKTVTVHDLVNDREFTESYDKLLLSPGARPTIPDVPGVDNDRIFTLRTVEDTLKIYDFIKIAAPHRAVMVGGGYIGLEVAENLRRRGLDVTIVQRPAQLLSPLDAEMASFVHAQVRAQGVDLRLSTQVTGFVPTESGLAVQLDHGASIETDLVILAVGITPDTALAKAAGLTLGMRGSIAVNERMETSVPDVFAVGDAVEVSHGVTGKQALVSLAGPANRQGRIAADNICGGDSVYRGSFGSSILKVFDLTVAATGINERTARAEGIDCESVCLSPASHATYYPGAQTMTMKLVFERETLRILGVQIVGYDGVDKRIDVLATAMQAGLTARQLKDLDLAYAPPYASAKDPVNMAGFIVDNLVSGRLSQFYWDEVESLPRDGSVTLLDTRTVGEYCRGHAPDFINIPLDDLRERLDELPQGKPVYVMCQSGLRSYLACRILMQNGFACYNFSGGYRLYGSIAADRAASRESFPCGMEK